MPIFNSPLDYLKKFLQVTYPPSLFESPIRTNSQFVSFVFSKVHCRVLAIRLLLCQIKDSPLVQLGSNYMYRLVLVFLLLGNSVFFHHVCVGHLVGDRCLRHMEFDQLLDLKDLLVVVVVAEVSEFMDQKVGVVLRQLSLV